MYSVILVVVLSAVVSAQAGVLPLGAALPAPALLGSAPFASSYAGHSITHSLAPVGLPPPLATPFSAPLAAPLPAPYAAPFGAPLPLGALPAPLAAPLAAPPLAAPLAAGSLGLPFPYSAYPGFFPGLPAGSPFFFK